MHMVSVKKSLSLDRMFATKECGAVFTGKCFFIIYIVTSPRCDNLAFAWLQWPADCFSQEDSRPEWDRCGGSLY
jgi:hypothetical protein